MFERKPWKIQEQNGDNGGKVNELENKSTNSPMWKQGKKKKKLKKKTKSEPN